MNNEISLFDNDQAASSSLTLDWAGLGCSFEEVSTISTAHTNVISLHHQARQMIGQALATIKGILKGKHNGKGWYSYCECLPYSRDTAEKLITEFENPEFSRLSAKFGNTGAHLLLNAPQAVKDKANALKDAGEDVGNAKIRQLTKEVDEANQRADAAEQRSQELEQQLEAAQNKPAETITIVKEVAPADYEETKSKLAKMTSGAMTDQQKARNDYAEDAIKKGVAESTRLREENDKQHKENDDLANTNRQQQKEIKRNNEILADQRKQIDNTQTIRNKRIDALGSLAQEGQKVKYYFLDQNVSFIDDEKEGLKRIVSDINDIFNKIMSKE